MGIEDLIFGVIPGEAYNKLTAKKKINPITTPITSGPLGPLTDTNTNVNENINLKQRLPGVMLFNHGGDVEITKGHDYIKDLL